MSRLFCICVVFACTHLVVKAAGLTHLTIESCCQLGDAWASQHINCEGHSSTLPSVNAEDRELCRSSFQICCLRSQRNSMCQTGKESAKLGKPCAVLPAIGGEAHKDCCDACNLGIKVGERGESCYFQGFSFSPPWDEAFTSCCLKTPKKQDIRTDLIDPAQNRCLSNNPCSQNCQNLKGYTVQCSCNSGYTLNSNGYGCDDVDECVVNAYSCNVLNETCSNVQGGFHCLPTLTGGRLGDNRPSLSRCHPGFIYNASSRVCDDIDECETFTHNCTRGSQQCTNTMGSFTCVDRSVNNPIKLCPRGFKRHPTKHCEDIDECAENMHGCDLTLEACFNSYGHYSCQPLGSRTCPAGYKMNNHNSCADVDECAEGLAGCLEGTEECVNTAGGFNCNPICGPGFFYDDSQNTCVDFDECAADLNKCPRGQNCINTLGSYQCVPDSSPVGHSCPAGFKPDGRGSCQDIDECQEGLHSCNIEEGDICINAVGAFDCLPTNKVNSGHNQLCSNGLRLDPVSRKCVDIDECAEGLDNCNRESESCQNVVASFRCNPREAAINSPCPRGYRRNAYTRQCEDLNECQIGRHNCEPSQRCDNTVGSFLCVRYTDCGTGYTLNAQTGRCEDDDECSLNPNTCGRDFICRNTEGSFRCDRITCPEGERLLSDGICHSVNCPTGMELDAYGRCSDVNECSNNPCKRNERCVNTPGSYKCHSTLTCKGGFEPNAFGTDCEDIDECQKRTHECGSNQICKNRQGGYSCECPVGFSLNANRVCEDVDECNRYRGVVCSINSECQNTPGSYICHCKPGFRKPIDSQNCEDIDECHETANICQHNCINTWGSFQCTCKPGFVVGADNRSCQDVDECELYKDKGSLCIGFCVNKPGSYGCSCPDGYRLGGDTRTCQDINECLEDGVCSGQHQTCLNTRGGYKCFNVTCPPNYAKDSAHKNRCKRADIPCRRSDDTCLKQPMSYSYNYLTMVSNMRIPSSGQLDLFTMRGPRFAMTNVIFNLEFKGARAPGGVTPATRESFHLRRTQTNEAMLSMLKTMEGPQEIELELNMAMYHNGQFGGSAVAKIFIIVSRYEF